MRWRIFPFGVLIAPNTRIMIFFFASYYGSITSEVPDKKKMYVPCVFVKSSLGKSWGEHPAHPVRGSVLSGSLKLPVVKRTATATLASVLSHPYRHPDPRRTP